MKNKIKIISFVICLIISTNKYANGQQGIMVDGNGKTLNDYAEKRKEKTTAKNTKEDIVEWLKSNISSNTPIKNKMINKILENALFDNMHVEQRDINRVINVVPLKKVYFSQHINIMVPLPFQNLLITENEKGEIEDVVIMLVYPNDKTLKDLPKNTFHDFYYQMENTLDGTYTLITVATGDFKVSEMDIKNGKRVQARGYHTKNVTSQYGRRCKKWSSSIIDYNKDGTINETSKDLGVSCTVCPPGFICDPLTTLRK